jgi:hypothetical protein
MVSRNHSVNFIGPPVRMPWARSWSSRARQPEGLSASWLDHVARRQVGELGIRIDIERPQPHRVRALGKLPRLFEVSRIDPDQRRPDRPLQFAFMVVEGAFDPGPVEAVVADRPCAQHAGFSHLLERQEA